jgi:hypothetical protein
MNGCAYCLDLHTIDARKAGESDRRLATLSVWRETPFFGDRERAALEWAESVTRVADTHVPDDVWERVQAAVHAGRAGRSDAAGQHDQRVEPVRHRIPQAAGLAVWPSAYGRATVPHTWALLTRYCRKDVLTVPNENRTR